MTRRIAKIDPDSQYIRLQTERWLHVSDCKLNTLADAAGIRRKRFYNLMHPNNNISWKLDEA